ncbi:MAG: hypothetical protein GYA50_02845 [Eubacteriaceae bacterium]|nr:hypothetical protein [Eubacteriaceae bacterium]
MSEGLLVLLGAIAGAAASALTIYFTERQRNVNALNARLREKREELYCKIIDALYFCLDSYIDNKNYDLDTLFNFYISKRTEVILYASYKIVRKFRDLIEFIGETQSSPASSYSPERVTIIREKIVLFINAVRNDLIADKNEHFDEGL